MNKYFFLILIIASGSLFAAGDGGHHASVMDLIYPMINWIAFMGVLIWALRPKMKTHFSNLNSNVQEVMERASKKAQESAVLLAEQEGKLANLDSEIDSLFSGIDERSKVYGNAYEQEVEERMIKLESDATTIIETERKQEIDKISGELLDQVISQAKKDIASTNQQEAISNKLVKGMQI